jgi:hypothetical protein
LVCNRCIHVIVFAFITCTLREYLLCCSYLEIYNETIYDLLAPSSTPAVQLQGSDANVWLAPLREEVVTSLGRPVSPPPRVLPDTSYLFPPLCLPRRLFVTTHTLTSLGVSWVRECSPFGRSTRWNGRCAPTWSGSSTWIPRHRGTFRIVSNAILRAQAHICLQFSHSWCPRHSRTKVPVMSHRIQPLLCLLLLPRFLTQGRPRYSQPLGPKIPFLAPRCLWTRICQGGLGRFEPVGGSCHPSQPGCARGNCARRTASTDRNNWRSCNHSVFRVVIVESAAFAFTHPPFSILPCPALRRLLCDLFPWLLCGAQIHLVKTASPHSVSLRKTRM